MYQMLFVYLDDICIYSKTFEEHLKHLDIVFTRLRQHNLKLKPTKCHMFQKEVQYLGHVLSADGISTSQDKVKAIIDWPVPCSGTHLLANLNPQKIFILLSVYTNLLCWKLIAESL